MQLRLTSYVVRSSDTIESVKEQIQEK